MLLRTTLAALTCAVGPDDKGTLAIENCFVNALNRLGEYAEAEALDRGTLEKQRHVLARDHRETLFLIGNSADSLKQQGKHTEAM